MLIFTSQGCSLRAISLTLLLLPFVATVAHAEVTQAKVIAVSDGDTVVVLTPDARRRRIRVAGIDAPEKGQPYGSRSRQNLHALAMGQTATLDCYKTDRYQRDVCRVWVGGRDIGLEQASVGMAWHFKRYLKEQSPEEQQAYARAEADARYSRRGLWADPRPVPPWDWRASPKSAR